METQITGEFYITGTQMLQEIQHGIGVQIQQVIENLQI